MVTSLFDDVWSICAWSILKRYDDRFDDILTDGVCTKYVSHAVRFAIIIARFAGIKKNAGTDLRFEIGSKVYSF